MGPQQPPKPLQDRRDRRRAAPPDGVPPARTGLHRQAHVQILMGVCNGMPHLEGQLASFAGQHHGDWSLLVGDDGSTDGSAAAVAAFAATFPGRVELRPGPQKRSAAANFLGLVAASEPGAYLAFSDQDDIWLPLHLRRALQQMAAAPGEVAVYAARTVLTDAGLRPRRLSVWPERGTWFGNALVQNVLAGNTILLSPAAADLMRATVPAALGAGVPFHDWWTYQVISGAGGRIVLNPDPAVLYRQHGRNTLGAHRGLVAGLGRADMVMRRRYAGWIEANLAALQEVAARLTPEARALLADFAAARTGPRRDCPARLAALGIGRQSQAGDRTLHALARLGRI